jgi:hypothetical protein
MMKTMPLMNPDSYRRLQEIAKQQSIQFIQRFANSEDNRDVYTFCIDAMESYGDFIVSLNTEASFEATAIQYGDKAAGFGLVGFLGVKFNPGDFTFRDLAPNSDELNMLAVLYQETLEACRSDREFEQHREAFLDALVGAIHELERDFNALDRTPDFVAFVSLHDAPIEDHIELRRRTIPEERFAGLFPEIVEIERIRQWVALQSADDQARFWLESAIALSFERDQRLLELGVTQSDALDSLQAVGQAAVPHILNSLERYAVFPEFNPPDSLAFREFGAFTREANLAHGLLLRLIDIGFADRQVEQRLVRILRDRHYENRDLEFSGLLPSLTARALHALFPSRYPEPQVSDRSNHLLNGVDFGVSAQ